MVHRHGSTGSGIAGCPDDGLSVGQRTDCRGHVFRREPDGPGSGPAVARRLQSLHARSERRQFYRRLGSRTTRFRGTGSLSTDSLTCGVSRSRDLLVLRFCLVQTTFQLLQRGGTFADLTGNSTLRLPERPRLGVQVGDRLLGLSDNGVLLLDAGVGLLTGCRVCRQSLTTLLQFLTEFGFLRHGSIESGLTTLNRPFSRFHRGDHALRRRFGRVNGCRQFLILILGLTQRGILLQEAGSRGLQ